MNVTKTVKVNTHTTEIKSAKQNLGAILKGARVQQGLSLYMLAKNTGLQPKQITAIEEGNKKYTYDSLLLLMNELSCKIVVNDGTLLTDVSIHL